MRTRDHELDVSFAASLCVCAELGARPNAWEDPEAPGATDPPPDTGPLDLIAATEASGQVGIEHCLLPSFADQVRDTEAFTKVIVPVQEQLDRGMPFPGNFDICVDAHAVNLVNLQESELSAIRAALVRWVLASGDIPVRGSYRSGYIEARPQGVPFRVGLSREIEGTGRVFACRNVPSDYRASRREEAKRLATRKWRKLQRYEQQGLRTAFVCEFTSVALDNAFIVSEAVAAAGEDPAIPAPELVYVVDTRRDAWELWRIKAPGRALGRIASRTRPVSMPADVVRRLRRRFVPDRQG